jgi:acyl-CoA dehydrogenase
MDFSLSDEQRLLVETARRFVAEELMPHEEEIERAGEMPEALRVSLSAKARAQGLYAANMPEEHGGGGLGHFDLVLLERELGRTSAALSTCAFRPAPILGACKGDQIKDYLIPCVRGERVDCFALTEPNAGSDSMNIATRAEKRGGDWVINGHKHFISYADVADFVIVMAVTGTRETPRGPRKAATAFLVDKGTPGFTVRRMGRAVGNRGYHQGELFFDDCRVPEGKILGEAHKGFDMAYLWLLPNRLSVAASCLGRADRVMEMAVEWAASRKAFGKIIAEHQGTGFKLADMAVDIRAAEFLTYYAAWKADQGTMTDADAAMAKVQASEMCGRVCDHAIQVFGGMGVMEQLPIQRFWRDARVERIWDGTSEIQRHIILKDLLAPHRG